MDTLKPGEELLAGSSARGVDLPDDNGVHDGKGLLLLTSENIAYWADGEPYPWINIPIEDVDNITAVALPAAPTQQELKLFPKDAFAGILTFHTSKRMAHEVLLAVPVGDANDDRFETPPFSEQPVVTPTFGKSSTPKVKAVRQPNVAGATPNRVLVRFAAALVISLFVMVPLAIFDVGAPDTGRYVDAAANASNSNDLLAVLVVQNNEMLKMNYRLTCAVVAVLLSVIITAVWIARVENDSFSLRALLDKIRRR